ASACADGSAPVGRCRSESRLLDWRGFLPRIGSVRSRRGQLCSNSVRPHETEGRGDRGPVTGHEIFLLLDPDLDEGRQTEIVSRTRELVEKAGGSWDLHDAWGR